MTRRDQVDAVAHVAGITTKQAAAALDAVAGLVLVGLLEEERFSFVRLGVFTVRRRAPRRVRNPQTGVMMDLPSSAAVKFKPAPELRRRVEERHS